MWNLQPLCAFCLPSATCRGWGSLHPNSFTLPSSCLSLHQCSLPATRSPELGGTGLAVRLLWVTCNGWAACLVGTSCLASTSQLGSWYRSLPGVCVWWGGLMTDPKAVYVPVASGWVSVSLPALPGQCLGAETCPEGCWWPVLASLAGL